MENSEPVLERPCQAGARKTPFQTKHALQYGLSITARDPGSSEVVVVRCQFCVCFGREVISKKSSTTWTFKGPPFRTDNYTQHLRLNHKTWWEEYQGLAHQEKSKYFDVAVKHAETICHYIESRSEAITLIVGSRIVDVVIGDMLWHPTEMEGQTRENALSLFKRKEDGSYLVEINKSKQFLLATRFVGRGMSFAMAADAIHDVKEVCNIVKLGACNDYLVASYARAACAISIEHISQVLCSKWAFSVAFDASTDLQQTSWVDVHIRYYQNSTLENLHLITLPFAGRHTGLATFEMFEKLFDVVCPLWKDKLIGCSTDGAANMTERLSGVVTQIQNVVKPNFMRVWCLLHQIDVIMQKVYKQAGCNFYKTLTSIISFLRRQKNLVEEMQAICPNLSATRWASMSRVARFLVEKRSKIVTYFAETEPSDRFDQLPTPVFWILISVISEISAHVSECVESLQGRRVTLQ